METRIPQSLWRHAPLWSQAIRDASSIGDLSRIMEVKGHRLYINHYANCIVGEKHGFGDSYSVLFRPDSCLHCRVHAMNLSRIIWKRDEDGFGGELAAFTRHCDHKHANN